MNMPARATEGPPRQDQAPEDPAFALADALPDAVLVVGDEGSGLAGLNLVSANKAARALLRLGRRLDKRLVSALRAPDILEAIVEVLASGEVRELVHEPPGERARFWRVRVAPLPAAADRRLALVLLRDESSARQAERQRADFVANASHELRTPLASIAGFIETLRGHARDDAVARERFLMIMASEADRMRRLIDGLLSLSRIEAHEHTPPLGVCDVAAMVSEVAGAMAPALRAHGLRAVLDLPSDPVVAIGDSDEIGQAIRNLAENAAKHAPAGGEIRIEVSGRDSFDPSEAIGDLEALRAADGGGLTLVAPPRPAEHGYVVVAVRDDGAGIAREHLPRLAERFFRGPGRKSGAGQGAGLGLAIAKHIVSRHRGALVVRSAPGAGAAFFLYWPRTVSKAS